MTIFMFFNHLSILFVATITLVSILVAFPSWLSFGNRNIITMKCNWHHRPQRYHMSVYTSSGKTNYAGCPEGAYCVKNGSISFFFFFLRRSYKAVHQYIYSLNSPLSYSGCVVLIVFNNSRPINIHSCRFNREGGDPLNPTCVTSTHHLIYLLKTN